MEDTLYLHLTTLLRSEMLLKTLYIRKLLYTANQVSFDHALSFKSDYVYLQLKGCMYFL